MEWEDPYARVFAAASGDNSPGAVLPENRWQGFLDQLAKSGLLTSETVARFLTDYRGERSFAGFRDQLVRLVAPNDSLQGLEDVANSLDESVALVERVLGECSEAGDAGDIPEFWSRASDFVSEISQNIQLITDRVRRDLKDYAGGKSLLGSVLNPQPTRRLHHAWEYQRDHARYLQAQPRRQRPRHVDTLMSGEDARKELLALFSPCLARFPDITIEMVTAEIHDRDGSPATMAMVLMLAIWRSRASNEAIAWIDTYIAAHSELLMSPYFVPYISSSERIAESSGEIQRQYYFELPPTTTLGHLIRMGNALFDGDSSVVMRHFAREILLALIDYHEQSTYRLRSPILPDNIFVSSTGRHVLLGKLDFGTAFDPFGVESASEFTRSRESDLLGDFARLLFAMRYHSTLPSNIDDFKFLYLARSEMASSYAHEFVIGQESVDEVLCVCTDDKFSVILVSKDAGSWILDTDETVKGLDFFESRLAPVSVFAFQAVVPGTYHLVFSHEKTVKKLAVAVVVSQDSFLRSSFSAVSQTVQLCAGASVGAATNALSLRSLLDNNKLFHPLSRREFDILEGVLSASLA